MKTKDLETDLRNLFLHTSGAFSGEQSDRCLSPWMDTSPGDDDFISLTPIPDEVLAVLPTAQNLNLAPLGITPKSSRVQNFRYKARKVQLHEETQRSISDTKNTLLQFMSCVFP